MRERHFLYLIGEPGAGKSTLVDALTANSQEFELRASGLPVDFRYLLWMPVDGDAVVLGAHDPVVEVGYRRGNFSGTDALQMNVQRSVEEWLGQHPYPLIFAEGDRLANDAFFRAVEDAGYLLCVGFLRVSKATGAVRRRERASRLGLAEQNPGWVKGRRTKVENLARRWAEAVVEIPADGDIEEAVAAIADHPVVRTLGSPEA